MPVYPLGTVAADIACAVTGPVYTSVNSIHRVNKIDKTLFINYASSIFVSVHKIRIPSTSECYMFLSRNLLFCNTFTLETIILLSPSRARFYFSRPCYPTSQIYSLSISPPFSNLGAFLLIIMLLFIRFVKTIMK